MKLLERDKEDKITDNQLFHEEEKHAPCLAL
jgi:hypothetical protein